MEDSACGLASRERATQVLEEVLDIFDAHGQPNEPVGDASGLPLLWREGCVGHRRGVFYQRLDPAEALREGKDLQSLQELHRAARVLQAEAKHPARAPHLPLRNAVTRMGR